MVSTYYSTNQPVFKTEHWRNTNKQDMESQILLEEYGDFRSKECIEILKEADLVISNCPFSLFREYVKQLMEYKKDFIIIGNKNCFTYKEIFPLLKDDKIHLGYTSIKKFYKPDGNIQQFGNIAWFTNLPVDKRNIKLKLTERYYGNEDNYPKYDNYNAIEVSKVTMIPSDYDGIMGVPITFLEKFNPNQFEILGSQRWCKDFPVLEAYCGTKKSAVEDLATYINGKETYQRIFIRHKKTI